MSDNEDNPKFAFKDIPLGQSIELTMEDEKPAISKEGKYGMWNLWFGSVENCKVHEGKGATEKIVEGYSGKVIFFPATKLNENLIKTANGNKGVKVKITKTAEEGRKGLITKYVVEKLSGGTPPDSSITPTEMRLIEEVSEIKNMGHTVTEDIFIKASQEPQYEGKISLDRAKKLYSLT